MQARTVPATPKKHKEGSRKKGARGLNPPNLRGVFGDDEDSKVVGAGIGRYEEEAGFPGIVSVRRAHQFFSVGKGDFGFSAAILGSQNLGFRVFAIAHEIPGEEDGLQILHLHVGAFALEGVLLKKKPEAGFLGGKIVDVTFQTAAIEEGHYCFIPIV